MEVKILGANTLYSVFCFFKALLPKQVWSGMVGKGINVSGRGFSFGPSSCAGNVGDYVLASKTTAMAAC